MDFKLKTFWISDLSKPDKGSPLILQGLLKTSPSILHSSLVSVLSFSTLHHTKRLQRRSLPLDVNCWVKNIGTTALSGLGEALACYGKRFWAFELWWGSLLEQQAMCSDPIFSCMQSVGFFSFLSMWTMQERPLSLCPSYTLIELLQNSFPQADIGTLGAYCSPADIYAWLRQWCWGRAFSSWMHPIILIKGAPQEKWPAARSLSKNGLIVPGESSQAKAESQGN